MRGINSESKKKFKKNMLIAEVWDKLYMKL
jgi:hypothetical protein